MEISGSISDLQKILFYSILAVIAQVYLLVVLSWNKTAIIVCIVLDIVLLLAGIIDYLYFSRKIILDVSGCSFVSRRATQKYTWRELYVQHTENPPYVFKDGEIPGEGVIISKHPIPKPLRIGAMTYCRFVHPSTSVFISFISRNIIQYF